jgi:hypothetical protein
METIDETKKSELIHKDLNKLRWKCNKLFNIHQDIAHYQQVGVYGITGFIWAHLIFGFKISPPSIKSNIMSNSNNITIL